MMFGPMGYGCTDGTYECSLFDAMIGRVKTRESATQVPAEANSLMIWSATNWAGATKSQTDYSYIRE
jgi:hypothetical protein